LIGTILGCINEENSKKIKSQTIWRYKYSTDTSQNYGWKSAYIEYNTNGNEIVVLEYDRNGDTNAILRRKYHNNNLIEQKVYVISKGNNFKFKSKTYTNSKKKYYYNSKNKLIKIESLNVINDTIVTVDTLIYNIKDSLVAQKTYNAKGSLFKKVEYVYNSKGLLIKSMTTHFSGQTRFKIYNKYTNTTSWVDINKTREYKYDNNNNKIEDLVYDSEGNLMFKTLYKYNNNKNLIETKRSDDKNKITSIEINVYDKDGFIYLLDEAKANVNDSIDQSWKRLDSLGRNIEVLHFINGNFASHDFVKYNNQGNILWQNSYSEHGKLLNKVSSKYDIYGNFTEQIFSDSTGNIYYKKKCINEYY